MDTSVHFTICFAHHSEGCVMLVTSEFFREVTEGILLTIGIVTVVLFFVMLEALALIASGAMAVKMAWMERGLQVVEVMILACLVLPIYWFLRVVFPPPLEEVS